MALTPGATWINFLRQYGPVPHNDNMYDEHIRRSAQRSGVAPITFTHPLESDIVSLFRADAPRPMSVVLTGTAGDGKSNLCRKIWSEIGGDAEVWGSNDIYFRHTVIIAQRSVTVHIVRDLTALPKCDHSGRYANKDELLHLFSRAMFDPGDPNVFVIAANDGQLMEPWSRQAQDGELAKVGGLLESLLVDDRREQGDVPLRFFNLSRVPCVELLDLALAALLRHEGWGQCAEESVRGGDFFGPRCPIRRNYELLQSDLVAARLRSLFELCDASDLHIPIRRVLLLLANTLLGHPEAKNGLMRAVDVPSILRHGTSAKASIFSNIFGGNLTATRRESLEVFSYLNRFGIGSETTNRIDNMLIFGAADDDLRLDFDALVRSDSFYGADASYFAAQRAYIEADEGDEQGAQAFLELLAGQRRRLFFVIPDGQEEEYGLWRLTVFQFAGEYLARVLRALRNGQRVERALLGRLVRGLNRIFVGMLVTSERDLLLATSFSISTAKVSDLLEDRIPVAPRLAERIELRLEGMKPILAVHFSDTIQCVLPLSLTRYEFLSRVAEGALPGSFSRECYEDILAFKSRLLACLAQRRAAEGSTQAGMITFRVLTLDDSGKPTDEIVEVSYDR